MSPSGVHPHAQRRVDVARLWAGGAATMIVAAGVALVGILAIQALFSLDGLARYRGDVFVGDKVTLAIASGLAALAATGLLHLLMMSAPRAHKFFAWIAGLAIVAVILEEFLTGYGLLDKLITSALYLIIGIAITSLLSGVARTAIRYDRPGERYSRRDRYGDDDTRYMDTGYYREDDTYPYRR